MLRCRGLAGYSCPEWRSANSCRLLETIRRAWKDHGRQRWQTEINRCWIGPIPPTMLSRLRRVLVVGFYISCHAVEKLGVPCHAWRPRTDRCTTRHFAETGYQRRCGLFQLPVWLPRPSWPLDHQDEAFRFRVEKGLRK